MSNGRCTINTSPERDVDPRFVELNARHRRCLLRTALRLCRNPSIAEEYVQETFLRYFQKGYSLRQGESAMERALLARILANVIIDASEKLRRESNDLHTAAPILTTAQLPSFIVQDKDLYSAIGQLSMKIRTTMWLYLEGLKNPEIAALQRIPVQTVAKRLFDGREKLKQLLSPKGPV
ncbi:RNA polymerase sigma factor [Hyalangium versicolor]|uniref:RNA polymerase sigma factor n=1 Tax=Hyalangium versicolor TaxID=2861190 RepID=UPI001CCEA081|nr:RNA polymerase sigma factor [Hyalangium versicolor]